MMNLYELIEELIRVNREIQKVEFAIDMLGQIGIVNEYGYLGNILECLEIERNDIEKKIRDIDKVE